MTPVGGSRHYDGGGLGQEAGWKCPSCGAENMGAIARGCTICGAGAPGRHIGTAPPPPPPQPEPEEPDTPLGPFESWMLAHPDATLEEAFGAGYVEGVRAALAAQQAQRPSRPAEALDVEGKVARTIVAALGYFADQILRHAPQEVQSGEWCSVEEVHRLIHQLTTTGEVAHA